MLISLPVKDSYIGINLLINAKGHIHVIVFNLAVDLTHVDRDGEYIFLPYDRDWF